MLCPLLCSLLTLDLDLDLRRMTASMIVLRTSCPPFCVSRGLLAVAIALIPETIVALVIQVGLDIRTALGIHVPVCALDLGVTAITIGLVLLHVILVPLILSPGLPLRHLSTLAPPLRHFQLRLNIPPPRRYHVCALWLVGVGSYHRVLAQIRVP